MEFQVVGGHVQMLETSDRQQGITKVTDFMNLGASK